MKRIEHIDDDEVRKETKEYISIDADGVPFLCYMIFEAEDDWCGGHRFYVDQRDLVSAKISNKRCPKIVREKYEWIGRYHNWCVREMAHLLKRSATMNEDDVWSFPSLMVKSIPDNTPFSSALWHDKAFREHAMARRIDIDWVRQWPGTVTEDDEPEDCT